MLSKTTILAAASTLVSCSSCIHVHEEKPPEASPKCQELPLYQGVTLDKCQQFDDGSDCCILTEPKEEARPRCIYAVCHDSCFDPWQAVIALCSVDGNFKDVEWPDELGRDSDKDKGILDIDDSY